VPSTGCLKTRAPAYISIHWSKRLAFGWRSGQFFQVLFSGIITDETRAHYYRTPLERLERVAPFLYYDAGSVYASVVDGEVLWFANALTTSKDFPTA